MVAAAVVEVFTPRDNTGAHLVAGGEHACSSIRCERGLKGFGHGVIPAHSVPSHRHGSFHGTHIGGQLPEGKLHSAISVEHDPMGQGHHGW